MSSSITFDTLAFVKRMKAVGFTEEQAEAQVEILKEVLGVSLATKADIDEVKIALAEAKVEIIKWIAGMLVAQAAVIAALVKLL